MKQGTQDTNDQNNHQVPWNKGKLIGQKSPLKLKEIWAIRIRLLGSTNVRNTLSVVSLFAKGCFYLIFAHKGSGTCLLYKYHKPKTLTTTKPPPIQCLKSKSLRIIALCAFKPSTCPIAAIGNSASAVRKCKSTERTRNVVILMLTKMNHNTNRVSRN